MLRALIAVLVLVGFAAGQYPVTYTVCGVVHTLNQRPSKVVTMNQGVTEFMLAMGLHKEMVGTAYLDDDIWPRYKTEYDKIPELNKRGYPTEAQIKSSNADFVMGSYASAFNERSCNNALTGAPGTCRGIFNVTTGPCEGAGSDWFVGGTIEQGKPKLYNNTGANSRSTCRPQLHTAGIGTWLEPTSCEDVSLRQQGAASEETVYAAIKQIGDIFNVPFVAANLISDIKYDFDVAEQTVKRLPTGIKAVWLDCVDRCCSDVSTPANPHVYVGAGTGAPNLIMKEAGLENVFKDDVGNWKCLPVSRIMEAKPDVMIVVHADWDTAEGKIKWMHNRSDFCSANFVKKADYIKIPFSASTLGPRNGVAALDLLSAALRLKTGSVELNFKSGVEFFETDWVKQKTAGLMCPYVPAPCQPGYEGPPGGPCTLCKADTYCLDGKKQTCPSSTSAPAGSSSVSQCLTAGGAEPYTHEIKFQVKLPFSKATFDAAKQIAFRVAVAETASVTAAAVTIKEVVDTRRASSALVDVIVKALSKSSADKIAGDVSAEKLNARLKANGLPEAEMVKAPSVSETGGNSGLSGGAIAGIVIGSIVGALLIFAVVVLIVREKQGQPVFMPLHDTEEPRQTEQKPSTNPSTIGYVTEHPTQPTQSGFGIQPAPTQSQYPGFGIQPAPTQSQYPTNF